MAESTQEKASSEKDKAPSSASQGTLEERLDRRTFQVYLPGKKVYVAFEKCSELLNNISGEAASIPKSISDMTELEQATYIDFQVLSFINKQELFIAQMIKNYDIINHDIIPPVYKSCLTILLTMFNGDVKSHFNRALEPGGYYRVQLPERNIWSNGKLKSEPGVTLLMTPENYINSFHWDKYTDSFKRGSYMSEQEKRSAAKLALGSRPIPEPKTLPERVDWPEPRTAPEKVEWPKPNEMKPFPEEIPPGYALLKDAQHAANPELSYMKSNHGQAQSDKGQAPEPVVNKRKKSVIIYKITN